MKKEEKGQLVKSLSKQISKYSNVYITDISDLDSVNTSKLRRLCFRRDVKLIVVKNTLLKKALAETGRDFTELFSVMKGPTSLMLAEVNNIPAKLIREFRGNSQKPILKGAFVEECFYIGDDQLDTLVNVKSKNELIGEIIGTLQSPLNNVISALKSGGEKLSGILETLSDRPE